jgi:hypothetical protein
VVGRHERPPDEVNGVIKAELALAILDVMVGEKLVELLGLFVIGKIDTAPFVTRGKVISCLLNIGHCLDFDRLVEGGLGVHLVILRDRLGVPEVVLIEERDCLSDLLEIPLVVILLALVLKFLEESKNIGSQSSLLSQVFVEKHGLKLVEIDPFDSIFDILGKVCFGTGHIEHGLSLAFFSAWQLCPWTCCFNH